MKKLFLSITLFAGVIAFALSAQATTLTFGLDYEFSGATPPEGTAPWITATFDDSYGGLNTVLLTMSADNLIDNEFIGEWLFNFDDSFDVTQLSFTPVGGTPDYDIYTGIDAYKADGDGYFDIRFDFPPPPGNSPNKFTAGETVVYDITYISSIDVYAFDFLSAPGGGQGTYYFAAHIQGIGIDDEDSGWIGTPVPEPSTVLLVGTGLLGMIAFGRKRLNKKA
jgi:hypothetical protein